METGGFVSREQETPNSYQQQSNQNGYASEDRPSISWKGSEGDAKYQKYYTTLPVHLQQTTGRMKRPREVANICTEKMDCKDHAADTCCWVPGSALPKECVKEVYTLTEHQSNLVYNPKTMTVDRKAMLQNVQKLLSDGSLQVMVLPVGQGDCIAMHCPNGKLVMFNCGSSSQQRSRGRTRALSADILKNVKVTIFISHGDVDHNNYLNKVFSDSSGEPLDIIEHVITGGHPSEYTGITAWIQAIAHKGKLYAINKYEKCIGDCNNKLHTIDQQWRSSNQMTGLPQTDICGTSETPVSFDIIAADVGNEQDKNQKSIVLKVTVGSRSVLFTGDMEGNAATNIATTKDMPKTITINCASGVPPW